jgi:hypothetical protein
MNALFSPNTRRGILTVILLVSSIGLAGCSGAGSNPTPTPSPAMVSELGSRLRHAETSEATPTVDPIVMASSTPANRATTVPAISPSSTPPTQRSPQATTEALIQPMVVPAEETGTQTTEPGQPPVSLPPLVVSPSFQELPAGSSAMFRINADDLCAHSYTFQAQGLPAGITAEFLGDAAPCRDTLVLNTTATVAPGSYTIQVIATQTDTSQSASAQITLNITGCSEFPQGEFTQAIQSNLVTLITAGKPNIEHGLLVPLQVCQDIPSRSLRVTLTAAMSEAGTPMAAPPRFYLYRSLVWPAPHSITAYGWARNVGLPRSNSDGWQLQENITPGLYLLVFERDYWASSPNIDPAHFPASVTYQLAHEP